MSAAEWAVVVALVTAVGTIAKALSDRRAVRAKATLDDSSATVAVTAAARELVDPLRKELAKVREEAAADLEAERKKVHELRDELEECTAEAARLRGELAMARVEADELRRDREQYRERDRQQSAEIADLKRRLRAV